MQLLERGDLDLLVAPRAHRPLGGAGAAHRRDAWDPARYGGTAQAVRRMGVPVERIKKLSEGSPNVVERIDAGEVDLVINTPTGSGARADGYEIRRAAVGRGVPCITTMSGASAAQRAVRARRNQQLDVISLQELHGRPPRVRTGMG